MDQIRPAESSHLGLCPLPGVTWQIRRSTPSSRSNFAGADNQRTNVDGDFGEERGTRRSSSAQSSTDCEILSQRFRGQLKMRPSVPNTATSTKLLPIRLPMP